MTQASAPRSLAEALSALQSGARPVAGATDLLVVDHATGRRHTAVVSLLGIEELQGIREAEGHLDIGGAVTFARLRESEPVKRQAPALAAAAATIGATQIQNRATIGGNIANASPAGDSLPVLLALGAHLSVFGPAGRRTLDYARFHTGYRTTELNSGEIIERILIPTPTPAVQVFRKVGTRAAQAISKVVLAFTADREGSRLIRPRLALGSVAATPVRLKAVEDLLVRAPLSRELADEAAHLAADSIEPIDDVRSTAAYRLHVTERLVRRVLLSLIS